MKYLLFFFLTYSIHSLAQVYKCKSDLEKISKTKTYYYEGHWTDYNSFVQFIEPVGSKHIAICGPYHVEDEHKQKYFLSLYTNDFKVPSNAKSNRLIFPEGEKLKLMHVANQKIYILKGSDLYEISYVDGSLKATKHIELSAKFGNYESMTVSGDYVVLVGKLKDKRTKELIAEGKVTESSDHTAEPFCVGVVNLKTEEKVERYWAKYTRTRNPRVMNYTDNSVCITYDIIKGAEHKTFCGQYEIANLKKGSMASSKSVHCDVADAFELTNAIKCKDGIIYATCKKKIKQEAGGSQVSAYSIGLIRFDLENESFKAKGTGRFPIDLWARTSMTGHSLKKDSEIFYVDDDFDVRLPLQELPNGDVLVVAPTSHDNIHWEQTVNGKTINKNNVYGGNPMYVVFDKLSLKAKYFDIIENVKYYGEYWVNKVITDASFTDNKLIITRNSQNKGMLTITNLVYE